MILLCDLLCDNYTSLIHFTSRVRLVFQGVTLTVAFSVVAEVVVAVIVAVTSLKKVIVT